MSDDKPARFDERTYVSIDHGMPENRKIVGLSDRAFRLYVEAICYCSRQQSDGSIPAAALQRMGRPATARELVAAGLFEPVGADWMVHDYLRHQRSADEIAAFRQSRAESGDKGAHMRWHVGRRRTDPNCQWCQGEVADHDATG